MGMLLTMAMLLLLMAPDLTAAAAAAAVRGRRSLHRLLAVLAERRLLSTAARRRRWRWLSWACCSWLLHGRDSSEKVAFLSVKNSGCIGHACLKKGELWLLFETTTVWENVRYVNLGDSHMAVAFLARESSRPCACACKSATRRSRREEPCGSADFVVRWLAPCVV